MSKVHVLFVCLGNICRSPLAEGIFRHRVNALGRGDEFVIDSASTSGWHDGKRSDPGSIEIAKKRGLDITDQRSRKLRDEDFDTFDWIIGMDDSNLENIRLVRAPRDGQLLKLGAFYAKEPHKNVPDPWQQGEDAFAFVFDMISESTDALIEHIDATNGRGSTTNA